MIGIDIVENERMRNKDINFIKRILSNDEYSKYETLTLEQRKIEYLASRFAAKEAIFKVFKKGNNDFNYSDISILNDLDGAPYVVMKGRIDLTLNISISHEINYSVAIVMKIK